MTRAVVFPGFANAPLAPLGDPGPVTYRGTAAVDPDAYITAELRNIVATTDPGDGAHITARELLGNGTIPPRVRNDALAFIALMRTPSPEAAPAVAQMAPGLDIAEELRVSAGYAAAAGRLGDMAVLRVAQLSFV